MENFFSSLKIARAKRKVYRTRNQARSDILDYIEQLYKPSHRHSTIAYPSPMQYEDKAMKAQMPPTKPAACQRDRWHAGKKGWKKRLMSDEEKGSICAQIVAPVVSVSQVAGGH